MFQLHPNSKSRPVQTIYPTDMSLLPSWRSGFGPPAQEIILMTINLVALRATVTFTYFPLMTLELIFDQNNAQLYALYVYCT